MPGAPPLHEPIGRHAQNIFTPHLVLQQIKAKLWLSLGLKIQSPLEVSNLVGCFKPHGNHPLLSSLRDLMKAGRLPSAGITRPHRYLCAPPTSRLPDSVFGCPYTQPSRPSPATSEISRVTHNNFPHIPSRRPRKVHLLLFGYLADGGGLPHLTTGSALSMTSYEALWVPWWYGLRVCDSSSEESFLDPLCPESRLSKPDLR